MVLHERIHSREDFDFLNEESLLPLSEERDIFHGNFSRPLIEIVYLPDSLDEYRPMSDEGKAILEERIAAFLRERIYEENPQIRAIRDAAVHVAPSLSEVGEVLGSDLEEIADNSPDILAEMLPDPEPLDSVSSLITSDSLGKPAIVGLEPLAEVEEVAKPINDPFTTAAHVGSVDFPIVPEAIAGQFDPEEVSEIEPETQENGEVKNTPTDHKKMREKVIQKLKTTATAALVLGTIVSLGTGIGANSMDSLYVHKQMKALQSSSPLAASRELYKSEYTLSDQEAITITLNQEIKGADVLLQLHPELIDKSNNSVNNNALKQLLATTILYNMDNFPADDLKANELAGNLQSIMRGEAQFPDGTKRYPTVEEADLALQFAARNYTGKTFEPLTTDDYWDYLFPKGTYKIPPIFIPTSQNPS